MKQLVMLVVAATLGSALTIGTFHFSDQSDTKEEKVIRIEHTSATTLPGGVLTRNEAGEIVPLDFRQVASTAMEAVVHIKSTQTHENGLAYNGKPQTLPDPFRHHFGDRFFDEFFGQRQPYRFYGPQNRGPQAKVGTGSGVIINEEGYIITNNHVIDQADDIEVTLHDNRTFKATVIGTDPSTDIALIKVDETGLPTIPLVNSDEVEVGEWVLAVGNPFNLNSTVTAGIVSAKARSINVLKEKGAIESFIQTDAAINPGNSGGALVNLNGGLVGINTAIASPTGAYTGYGFAVPSNMVNKVVEDLLKYGIVQRGYLGVLIRGVDGNLVREKDLDVNNGVYVDSLMENSAARKAGVQKGDVILEIDGTEVNNAPQLQELIGRKRPGDKISLSIDRKGKRKTLEVTLHNRNGETDMVKKADREILSVLGAELEPIDRKTAKKLSIDGGVKVAKLLPGKLRKHTDMREGFIITKVDGKKVAEVDEVFEYLDRKKGGVLIEGVYENYPGVYYYAFGM